MNKEEAAKILNCSVRSIERYMQAGRLTVRYEQGTTRSVAVLDDLEVYRLKDELEPAIKPAIDESTPTNDHEALAVFGEGTGGIVEVEQLGRIIDILLNTQAVRISEKTLLTIQEARMLTGLSKDLIRNAIANQELKARKIGKSWRIKRKDLDEYIDNL